MLGVECVDPTDDRGKRDEQPLKQILHGWV